MTLRDWLLSLPDNVVVDDGAVLSTPDALYHDILLDAPEALNEDGIATEHAWWCQRDGLPVWPPLYVVNPVCDVCGERPAEVPVGRGMPICTHCFAWLLEHTEMEVEHDKA
jgi:hypothetical protein